MTSWLEEVNKPQKEEPIRALIYGIEGVGKSTFCARAPKPIFISAEGGTARIRPRPKQMKNTSTWDGVRDAVKKLTVDRHPFETLVIDSADWVEKMAHAKIIGSSNKDIIRFNGGFGAGYRDSERLHRELIDDLTHLYETKGMNILVTAHYHVRISKDPEAIQDYDTFQIKCHEFVSALWREWSEAILFARFETLVKVDDEKGKGRAMGTGRRVMYTEQRPAFAAKNRFNLPFEMPVEWEAFQSAVNEFNFGGNPEKLEDVVEDIKKVLAIAVPPIAERIQKAVDAAAGDLAKLIKIRDHARVTVNA